MHLKFQNIVGRTGIDYYSLIVWMFMGRTVDTAKGYDTHVLENDQNPVFHFFTIYNPLTDLNTAPVSCVKSKVNSKIFYQKYSVSTCIYHVELVARKILNGLYTAIFIVIL